MNAEKALVIIPTYNERENIAEIVPRVLDAAPSVEVLVVDDASPDGTADLAASLFGESERFHLLRRTGKRGLGLSYVEAFQWAMARGYGRVVQMDADLSHDPAHLPDLLGRSGEFDMVLGSRYCRGGGVRNWPARRILLSRYANLYVGAITGVPVRDATSGFRCYTRRALECLGLDEVVSNGYAFQVEMTYRAHQAGLRIAESPIVFVDRTRGKSKMSGGVITESVVMPWRLRFGRAVNLGRK